jgi:hypothetical protein
MRCKVCQYQVDPDPAEMATRYGAETSRARLAPAAGLFPLRRPAGRYGGDRNEALSPEKVIFAVIAEKSDGKRDGNPERPDF